MNKIIAENDPKYKICEITICFMSITILILLFMVLFFLNKKPINNCDVNRDGKVDVLDLLIVRKEILKGEENESN